MMGLLPCYTRQIAVGYLHNRQGLMRTLVNPSILQGGDGGMEYAMCTLITGNRMSFNL